MAECDKYLAHLNNKMSLIGMTFYLGGRGRQISEFEASLVYKVSSRTARAIQRNPVLKNKTKENKQTNKQTKN
jgi:GTP cyclohydrolase II